MNRNLRQTLLPILAAVIWGVAFVFQKGNTTGPLLFNASRNAVAVVFLFIVLLIRRRFRFQEIFRKRSKKEKKALYFGGLLIGTALCLATFCQQYGMDSGTDAGKAGFITALYVVFVPVFALFFHKRASLVTWISVVVALVGLYLLSVKAHTAFTIAPSDLIVIGAAFLFTLQILFIDKYSVMTDPVELTLMEFLVSFILSLVLSLIFERLPLTDALGSIVPILYLGIVSSGIGYTLQIVAQKGTNPTVVSVLMSAEALFSVLAGAVFLHERMTVREIVGAFVMMAAVVLSILSTTLPQKKAKNPAV